MEHVRAAVKQNYNPKEKVRIMLEGCRREDGGKRPVSAGRNQISPPQQ